MLKRITSEIMGAARLSDFTYRFGGEEFVVIADGIAGAEATALGERIRRAIAGAPVGDAAWQVTASIGIASCAKDGSGYDRLFEIADKRLYQAKAAGRNKVIGERGPTETAGAAGERLMRYTLYYGRRSRAAVNSSGWRWKTPARLTTMPRAPEPAWTA